MDKHTHYVCWTGGWDSTYRVVQLSQQDTIIQPVYVLDTTRPTLKEEMETIEKLRLLIIKDNDTKATINTIQYVPLSALKDDEAIAIAYKTIREKVKLGSQYLYLAKLAKLFNNIEIGIEKPNGEFNGCAEAINQFGRLKEENGTYVIDREKSTESAIALFGNCSYPLINTTENQMLENIRAMKKEDIMKNIHFCYSPKNSQPCGVCRPCVQKIESNMGHLLPKKAIKRYKLRYKNKIGILLRKIKARIKG